MDAKFKHGDPRMEDYQNTSGSTVAGGTVLIVGNRTVVTHRDILDGEVGAAASRGGTYEMVADGALAVGVNVYWDDTAKKVTATTTGNLLFGTIVDGFAAAADGDLVRVQHLPDGAVAGA